MGWQPFRSCRKAKPIASTHNKNKCPQGSRLKEGENDEPIERHNGIPTTEQSMDNELDHGGYQCVCGRSFTTEMGMKIHRTKKGCLEAILRQRTDPVMGSDKTADTPSQDANHSAGCLHAEECEEGQPNRRERIRFPKASQAHEWAELDTELCQALKDQVSGPARQKIVTFGETIYEFCKAKYGAMVRSEKKLQAKSRRQREIEDTRRVRKERAGSGKKLRLVRNQVSKLYGMD